MLTGHTCRVVFFMIGKTGEKSCKRTSKYLFNLIWYNSAICLLSCTVITREKSLKAVFVFFSKVYVMHIFLFCKATIWNTLSLFWSAYIHFCYFYFTFISIIYVAVVTWNNMLWIQINVLINNNNTLSFCNPPAAATFITKTKASAFGR